MFSKEPRFDKPTNSTLQKEPRSSKDEVQTSVWKKRFRRTVVWSLISYFVFLILLIPLMRIGGDRYWLATLFLYSPRMAYGVPFLFFIPMILYVDCRRSYLAIILVSLFLWLGPIMGFAVPWQEIFAGNSPEHIRVLTCNICGDVGDRQVLSNLVKLTHVNLVALQEYDTKSAEVAWPEKWHSVHHGELLIASQWPILRTQVHYRLFPPSRWPGVNALYCVVDTPNGKIGFATIHFQTAREGLLTVLDRKTIIAPSRLTELSRDTEMRRKESAEVRQWLNQFPEPKLIVGDFNMPADSSIFRRDWASYRNAFDYAGTGLGMTKQTEMPFFGGTFGIRIDQILADETFYPTSCWVGPNIGSDHRPLLGEVIDPARD